MMNEELKPCPFCGATPEIDYDSFGRWWLSCACGVGVDSQPAREAEGRPGAEQPEGPGVWGTGPTNRNQSTHERSKAMIGQDMIGQYVIVRCYSAGVHAGTLAELDGDKAVLTDSNRLWYWVARSGVALSGVAQNGIAKGESKIDVLNPRIYLTGVIEIIPVSVAAQESIRGK